MQGMEATGSVEMNIEPFRSLPTGNLLLILLFIAHFSITWFWIVGLTLCMLCKNFSSYIFKYFSYFFPENRFDSSCKLSSVETICMNCHILFSGKNKNGEK